MRYYIIIIDKRLSRVINYLDIQLIILDGRQLITTHLAPNAFLSTGYS